MKSYCGLLGAADVHVCFVGVSLRGVSQPLDAGLRCNACLPLPGKTFRLHSSRRPRCSRIALKHVVLFHADKEELESSDMDKLFPKFMCSVLLVSVPAPQSHVDFNARGWDRYFKPGDVEGAA